MFRRKILNLRRKEAFLRQKIDLRGRFLRRNVFRRKFRHKSLLRRKMPVLRGNFSAAKNSFFCSENYQYARVAKYIEDKSKLFEEKISGLTDIVGDEDKAKEIVEATKASMGRILVLVWHNFSIILYIKPMLS